MPPVTTPVNLLGILGGRGLSTGVEEVGITRVPVIVAGLRLSFAHLGQLGVGIDRLIRPRAKEHLGSLGEILVE